MAPDTERRAALAELSGLAYGIHLRGRLPASFEPYLAGDAVGGAAPRSLRLTYQAVPELPRGVEEVWASETDWPSGGGRFAVFRMPEGFGLSVAAEGRGALRCTSRAIRIEWVPPGTGAAHYLFSYALPLWLETEGVPVLHGSAVSADGRAVGFLGPSGAGKSVLCAELLGLGCGFLADDALALRRDGDDWRCAQGPPLLRLWPSGLERRLEIPAHPLPRVHETLDKRQLLLGREQAGSRAAGPRLAALYVLRRRPGTAGGVEIAACTPRDALVRLIEHGIAGGPAAALGLSAGRLERLADLAEKVPVRLLSFPSGGETAARVLEAVRPA